MVEEEVLCQKLTVTNIIILRINMASMIANTNNMIMMHTSTITNINNMIMMRTGTITNINDTITDRIIMVMITLIVMGCFITMDLQMAIDSV